MLANALVIQHLDYCDTVWSNCSVTLSNSLQLHQNRLARILLSADIRTRINDMMNALNWVPLEKRWNNHLLIMLFKCLTDNAPNYLSSKFSFVSSNHSHGTRSQTFNALNHPQWKINPGKRTFHNRACSAWNQLPITVRETFSSLSLQSFKELI